jgi:hypothetical protein
MAYEALRDACVSYVERLFEDAGVTPGMTQDERDRRITKEYRRRAFRAKAAAAERAVAQAIWRNSKRTD